MIVKRFLGSVLVILVVACSLTSSPISHTIAPSVISSPIPGTSLPPVTGPDPSYKVAAFYYPWYGNPKIDGQWIHWTQNNHLPPQDISSDYYPVLGAYSSYDPAVVAQHMAWLRQAGIGVIIVSWWGQGTNEDGAVPLILQMAERYGIKVTFHIEPYETRTAAGLVTDVKYIYQKYGSSPAFFRSTASTSYSPGNQPKGMFFVWNIESYQMKIYPTNADYWKKAVDEIHSLPDGGLVIANTLQGNWIDDGHFDGLYNYVTLHPDQDGGFSWARGLPSDSLYIPSVIPGNSAKRVGYPPDTYIPRDDGKTFADQWLAALGTGIQPEMITITSFNEWHEGTMIEPIAVGVSDGKGYAYPDFGKQPADGYLTLTHQWIDKFLATQWPPTYRAQIKIATTSDWTTLNIFSGGAWLRPDRISASNDSTRADMNADGSFELNQSLDQAKAGRQVEMVFNMQLIDLDPSKDIVFNIAGGCIGGTKVTIYNYLGATPVEVKSFNWIGMTSGCNAGKVSVPASAFTASKP